MYPNNSTAALDEMERQRTGIYGNDLDNYEDEDVSFWDLVDMEHNRRRDEECLACTN